MAKQFDPRKVLRQITNDLLRQFFAARDELPDVPWKDLSETEVQAIFDACQGLSEPKRREVQVALQDINELADDRGLAVLAEEIQWRCPKHLEEFVAIESRMDKAMWVYLRCRWHSTTRLALRGRTRYRSGATGTSATDYPR